MNMAEDKKVERMLKRLGNYQCEGQISLFDYTREQLELEKENEIKEFEDVEL